jgi:hypothetical protein
MSAKKICPQCAGTKQCPSCSGRGYRTTMTNVLGRTPHKATLTGRAYEKQKQTCPVCCGDGVCPQCHGTGLLDSAEGDVPIKESSEHCPPGSGDDCEVDSDTLCEICKKRQGRIEYRISPPMKIIKVCLCSECSQKVVY